MKYTYVIADNAVAVTVADGLDAWREIEPRYRPFAAEEAGKSMLKIGIATGTLQANDDQCIYEPEFAGVGFITARAACREDGSVVMDFRHAEEDKPRLRMSMPHAMDRADIVFDPAGDGCDTYFLTHALMIAYMLGTLCTGTLLIHASAVLLGGKAYLFQGKSGTGKSTHAGLWLRNIPGTERLNDDNPVIRFSADGVATAYGSPWSGKTHCYRAVSAPIGAIVRIVRAKHNELHHLAPLRAYASLTTSVFYMPFLSEDLRAIRHKVIERLACAVPCCEMHCLPDADAARVCHQGLDVRY
ncbi:MAG: hypothetical protein K2N16_09030 [Muribaculaceae bacterium]|nr:hypothetical protein [Muribaculaceae bacterium]